MIEVTRGNIVYFNNIQFRDADKDVTVPDAAYLRVRYLQQGDEKFYEVALTESGGLWSGQWDSTNADPGVVFWHARATSPTAFAIEGRFRLRANPANGLATTL